MRDFTGIPFEALPTPEAPDFTPRLKGMLANLDYFLRDLGTGVHNLDKGLTTTGGIPPTTVDLSKFLYLPGRAGGQKLFSTGVTENTFIIGGVASQTGNVFEVDIGAAQVIATYFNVTATRAEVRIGGSGGGNEIYMRADGSFGYIEGTNLRLGAHLGGYANTILAQANTIQLLGQMTTRPTLVDTAWECASANIGAPLTDASHALMVRQFSLTMTGDLLRFVNPTNTGLLSRVKSDGTWDGPVSGAFSISADDSLFNIFNHATPSKILKFSLASITAATTRTWTVPDASGTVALLERAQTFSGAQTFDNNVAQPNLNILHPNAGSDEYIRFVDAANSANYLLLQGAGTPLSGAITLTIPSGGSATLVTSVSSAALTNKSIQSGTVNLAGQTLGIGTTNITINPSATQPYVVEVVAMCTTPSGSGGPTLDVTIGWTDNVGATSRNVTADPGSTAFPLSLAGTGRASARVLLRRASGNITYATTINAASGTPQYALYIRVLSYGP